MNIVLWVLQVVLAFFYISGGAYKVLKTETLAGHFRSFPLNGWRAIGLIEVVGGVLLVVPVKFTGIPMLTAMAAALLTIESAGIAVAYGRKSMKMVAANPFAWTAPLAIVAAIVAYGRYALSA